MAWVLLAGPAATWQERGPSATAPGVLGAAIDDLGHLDYPTRAKAGRVIRRAPAAQAVPALLNAVREHADGFVRFRSLVLLTGFADPRTGEQMAELLDSPNDRLREVAYRYFERHVDRRLTPRMLAALDREHGEFVRPSLVRALAAVGDDPAVRDALLLDVTRGVDHFRSSVIDALGDYKRSYARTTIEEVAALEGPLQDDAVSALGKIGQKEALATLAGLQRTGPRTLQPAVAAAICLLGVNCASHIAYLGSVLGFAEDNPGYQELVRGAAAGLADVAIAGHEDAIALLVKHGVPSTDPMRAVIALAVGKVALRNTALLLKALEAAGADQTGAIALVAEGFDMLEEDLDEEQFFVLIRRQYWAAPEGSALRRLSEQLINTLDF